MIVLEPETGMLPRSAPLSDQLAARLGEVQTENWKLEAEVAQLRRRIAEQDVELALLRSGRKFLAAVCRKMASRLALYEAPTVGSA